MLEISSGIYEATKRIIGHSSISLAFIFFCGHVLIAMAVVSVFTGASIWEAGTVALIEPAINSGWFYILHRIYRKINER
jgi:uncharacterized membrane protein